MVDNTKGSTSLDDERGEDVLGNKIGNRTGTDEGNEETNINQQSVDQVNTICLCPDMEGNEMKQ